MFKLTEKPKQLSIQEKNQSEQSKYHSKVFRDGLRFLALSTVPFIISACSENSNEIKVDSVIQQEQTKIQNEREIIQKELKEKKLELKNLQAQIDKTENQDKRLKLVVEFDDLKSKYRDYFAGLSFEDREYFKNRIDLIN